MKTLVLKFGGASVSKPENFEHIAQLILQRKQTYQRIAVVVSAMGNTTDQLISLAKEVHPEPPKREYDMLISAGERISMSLLAMALSLKEQKARSFTGSQTGIITCNNHSDAKIIDVKPYRIEPFLNDNHIVIVAGFQGVSKNGEITTLGRGGSDTSAVALALAIGAEKVEFYKDVPGIFSQDPKVDPLAEFHSHLTYEAALKIAERGEVLHYRSIALAKNNFLPLVVRSFNEFSKDSLCTTIALDGAKRRKEPIFEKEVI